METGALGAGRAARKCARTSHRSSKSKAQNADGESRQPLTLTALVTDDGIPKRRAGGGSAAVSNVGSRRDAGCRRSVSRRCGPGAATSDLRDAASRPCHCRKERRPAPVLVRLPRHGCGDVRSPTGQTVEERERGATLRGRRCGLRQRCPRMQVVVHAIFSEPGTYVFEALPTTARCSAATR